jgi:hypothetical protein
MSDLDSGLKTHDSGGQGFDATYNTNFELVDEKLKTLFTSTNIVGEQTVTDNNGSANDPNNATATNPTLTVIPDTDINNNFNELKSKVDALITDNASLRTQLIAAIDYSDGLRQTINDLLQKLRNSGVIGQH